MNSNQKGKQKIELDAIHDFSHKLVRPELLPMLKDYVHWQISVREKNRDQLAISKLPEYSPVSINLDLTTACNYQCGHCIDIDILNKKFDFDFEQLKLSLELMITQGLKSVIVIGGGEPTVHPKFSELIYFLKERRVQVGVVSNGSRMEKLQGVAGILQHPDWIRLSLDSGTDQTFQAMHKPRKKLTLQEICKAVPIVRELNQNLDIGFSFIVTWKGAFNKKEAIVENISEIYQAARLARDNDFTYFSIKPFLERAPDNNAEVVGIDNKERSFEETIKRIRSEVKKARTLETDNFRVVESTNLKVLESGDFSQYTAQPKCCHITFFRQVFSPLGIFSCPVYRHVDEAKLGDQWSLSTNERREEFKTTVGNQIMEFDASANCKKVVCLYNSTNWFIDDLINNPEKLDDLSNESVTSDFFF